MTSERVEKVIKTVLGKLSQLVPANRFYVALHDPVREEIQIPLIITNDGQVNAPVSYLYKGMGALPDRIIEQNQIVSLVQRDLEKEEELICWDNGKRPDFFVGIPILVEKNAIGSLVIERWGDINPVTEGEKQLLMAVAGQAAVALERARLDDRLEKKISYLQAVNEIGQKITSSIRLSEPQILDLIYKHVSPLMDTRNMYIALYDPDPSQIDEYKLDKPEDSKIHGTVRFGLAMNEGVRVNVKTDRGWQPRKAGHGLTEYVIRTKQFFRPVDVLQAYERIATEYIGKTPKSWLGVPMMAENRILGVVVLRNELYENIYSEDDQEILQMLARDAAVALENVRLYDELEHLNEGLENKVSVRTEQLKNLNDKLEHKVQARTQQLRTLQDIAVDMTSETDLERLLKTIMLNVKKLFESSFSTLYVYDPQIGVFSHKLRKGKIENDPSYPVEGGVTYELIQGQEPIYVENASRFTNIKGAPIRKFIKSNNVKAFAAVPLLFRQETVGVLYINYQVPHSFLTQEKEIISILANQVAVAINNAVLVRQIEDNQKKIAEKEAIVTRSLIATDLVHRLNNLTGTIPIWVDQIRNLSLSHPKLDDYLEKIDSNTDNILQAAEHLSDPPEKQWVDIKRTLESLSRQIRVQTLSSVQVTLNCSGDIASIYAEVHQIANTLWSIIQNGVEAMPAGGTLDIKAENLNISNKKWVKIQVSDEGTGINVKDMERVFLPFASTKHGHMGYGLWRAKHIIEELNGRISLDDNQKAESGSVFTILLPVIPQVEVEDA